MSIKTTPLSSLALPTRPYLPPSRRATPSSPGSLPSSPTSPRRGGSGGGSCGGTNNGKSTGTPWDPIGYCWAHGYKVSVVHSSAMYNKRKDRHDTHLTAKRGNIQGGCEWNITWTPMVNWRGKQGGGSMNIYSIIYVKLANKIYLQPGCANPPDINTTVLVDSSANVLLLANSDPANELATQIPTKKSSNQPEQGCSPPRRWNSCSPNCPRQPERRTSRQGLSITSFLSLSCVMQVVKLFFTALAMKWISMKKSLSEGGATCKPTCGVSPLSIKEYLKSFQPTVTAPLCQS